MAKGTFLFCSVLLAPFYVVFLSFRHTRYNMFTNFCINIYVLLFCHTSQVNWYNICWPPPLFPSGPTPGVHIAYNSITVYSIDALGSFDQIYICRYLCIICTSMRINRSYKAFRLIIIKMLKRWLISGLCKWKKAQYSTLLCWRWSEIKLTFQTFPIIYPHSH